jgi:hypothetical protein
MTWKKTLINKNNMKGIFFSEPLFHNVVDGTKTQIRRVVNPQPDDSGLWNDDLFPRSLDSTLKGWNGTVEVTAESKEFKPRYRIGETVFLQEPYAYAPLTKETKPFYPELSDYIYQYEKPGKWDKIIEQYPNLAQYYEVSKTIKWKSQIYMPAKAARYFIEITGVRCERLQDISDEDCIKEGILPLLQRNGGVIYNYGGSDNDNTPKRAYAALFELTHKKGLWKTNPFVWVYDFKLIK